MTRRQLEYLAAIDRLARSLGVQPTYRELGYVLNVWPSTVCMMTCELQSRGLVTSKAGTSRTLRLTEAGRQALARAEGGAK
jgi:Mn-dependent DtxR family transcriptional regulator